MSDTPFINDRDGRKRSIVENTPAIFQIVANQNAMGAAPFYEWEAQSEVGKWCGMIVNLAMKYRIDPDLINAIMYMETTHGWYDKINPARHTILPMNIHYQYWRELGVTKEMLECPYYNVEFGAIILSRIKDRLLDPTVEKIGSIYNFLGAEKVTDYGARIHALYWKKPWKKQGCDK
jgi:hypothetical protein